MLIRIGLKLIDSLAVDKVRLRALLIRIGLKQQLMCASDKSGLRALLIRIGLKRPYDHRPWTCV